MGALADLTEKRFGRLTVVRRVYPNTENNGARWECKCDCGGVYVTSAKSLNRGAVESCGCLRKESARRVLSNHVNTSNHGMTESREYRIWGAMKTRCGNANRKQYADYGGRGIEVCQRWADSFEAFFQDMGPCPEGDYSIDRIDNNGNYDPGNCRWASRSEQSNNKRDNVRIRYGDREQTAVQWSEELGIPPATIRRRFRDGQDIARRLRNPRR